MYNTTSFPHSERNFRRFEPYIRNWLMSWPSEYRFRASELGLRSTTAVARLRDALASYWKVGWRSEIDRAVFERAYPDSAVTIEEDSIILRPRKGSPLGSPELIGTREGDVLELDLTDWTPDKVYAVLNVMSLLLGARKVPFMVQLQTLIPPSDITTYMEATQAQADVDFRQINTTTWLLT